MPFIPCTPRTYSTHSVLMHAPTVPGVYGITNAGEWIYIGSTANIQASLLMHLGESHSAIQQHEPTGFIFEACDQSRQADRHKRLIFEYSPTFNRIGAPKP